MAQAVKTSPWIFFHQLAGFHITVPEKVFIEKSGKGFPVLGEDPQQVVAVTRERANTGFNPAFDFYTVNAPRQGTNPYSAFGQVDWK